MNRIIVDLSTGEASVVPLTEEEAEAARLATEKEALENSVDSVAPKVIDSMDRLSFEVMLSHENRLRKLEGKPEAGRAQFRDALIEIYKNL